METNTKTMLAAGGILAVALTIGSQIDGTKTPVPEPVSVQIAQAKRGAEIKALRTVNSEVFKADSAWVHPKDARGAEIKADSFKVAAFTAKVYARPKYFRDAEGDTLRPLDLTVKDISALAKLNPLKTHDKYVDAGPYNARWMADKPGDFRMDTGGAYVKYRALFDAKNATIAVNATADGMKEMVTLADKDAPHTLRWIVETDGSLVANAAGGFDVRAKDGTVPMRIGKPVAWDADKKPVMASATVEGDTLTFRVTVLPGQEYPVTVDPTTSVKPMALDGYVQHVGLAGFASERNATSGTSAGTGTLLVGMRLAESGNEFTIQRSFLGFPISYSAVACTLWLDGVSDFSDSNFTIYAVAANDARSIINTDDYSKFNGWASSGAYTGTKLSENWTTNLHYSAAWNALIFTSSGIDSINACKGDTLWIALLSSRDYNATAPSGADHGERVVFSGSSDGESVAPYLSITWTAQNVNPLVVRAASTTSVKLSWSDNVEGESAYLIYDLDLAAYIDSTAANDTTKVITGLTANTKKRYRIDVRGGTMDGQQSNPDSTYTLANTPAAPTVTNPADSIALVKIDTTGTGNPLYTEYAIQDSISGKYFDGRFNRFFSTTAAESILWRTFAAWGGTSGDTVAVGVGKKYRIRVKARSGE